MEAVEFPRWLLAASIFLIGLMLFLGWIAGPDGSLRRPGLGACVYFAAVIAVAAALAFIRARKVP